MKVGVVIYGSLDTVSGGYLYDRMLVSKLRQRGDSVEVISLSPRTYAANLLDNITYDNPGGFDVLLQDELNHRSLLLANRRAHPAPIISIVHHLRSSERRPGWQNSLYRGIERLYLDSVDGFILNSDVTRQSVERLSRGRRPLVVATPGGDRLGMSTPDQVVQRAHQSGPLRLLYLGGLSPGKGLDVLLSALTLVSRPEFGLEVVGRVTDKRFAGRMHRMVADLELPVLFRGELADDALAEELRNSHVLVLPSHYEGFGIAYLEGMAHGLAALGSAAGAIPDLITDGVEGYLVPPGDARALSEHLERLGHQRDLLARLGLAALARFGTFPTWDQTIERMRAFLLSVAPT